MHHMAGISVGVQDLDFSPPASASIGTGHMGPPQSIEVIGGSSSQAQSTSLSGSTSGHSGKRRRHMTTEERSNRPETPSKECLKFVQDCGLQFYRRKSKEYLETKYLHHGVHGLAQAVEDMKVHLGEAVMRDPIHSDATHLKGYGSWLSSQVQQAVYNPTQWYDALNRDASGSSGPTGDPCEELGKLIWWKNYAKRLKESSGRLPPWADKLLVGHLSSQGRTGVMWIPRSH